MLNANGEQLHDGQPLLEIDLMVVISKSKDL